MKTWTTEALTRLHNDLYGGDPPALVPDPNVFAHTLAEAIHEALMGSLTFPPTERETRLIRIALSVAVESALSRAAEEADGKCVACGADLEELPQVTLCPSICQDISVPSTAASRILALKGSR